MRLRKAAGSLGAYVDDLSLADSEAVEQEFTAFHAALLEHEVLFLRDQQIEPQAFQALARRFGQVEGHPAYPTVPDAEDVQILESTEAQPSKIEAWHTDMTFRPTPPAITLLHGQIIPVYGGDTLWSSASAAFAALSEPLQTFLEDLEAVHDFRHGFRESLAEPGGEERLRDAVEANPPITHPLVIRHPESGKRAIYVNSLFTTHIAGLSRDESRAVLEFLYQHLTIDEFTVRLQWQPGTIAVWDNRLTQHKPVNDFFPQHRRMHRVTIAGDRPAA